MSQYETGFPSLLEKQMKHCIYQQPINSSVISLVVLVTSYFLQKSNVFHQASLSRAANLSAEPPAVCLLLHYFATLQREVSTFH